MGFSILQIPSFLWQEYVRYRWWILIWAIAVAVATLVVSSAWPYRFQAVSGIRFEEGSLAFLFGDSGENQDEDWNIVLDARRLLQEQPLAKDMGEQVSDTAREILAGLDEKKWVRILEDTTITQPDDNTLQVRVMSDTQATANSHSIFVVEVLGERFTAFLQRRANARRDFVTTQVKTYEDKLVDAEKKMRDFKLSNAAYSDQSGDISSQRIQRLQQNIEETLGQLSEHSVRMRIIDEQMTEGTEAYRLLLASDDYKNERTRRLKEEVMNLEADIKKLSQTYTDNYPPLKDTREQLRQAQEALKKEQEKPTDFTSNPYVLKLKQERAAHAGEIEGLKVQLSELRKQLDEENKRAANLSEAGQKLQTLQRDYEVNRQLYEKFLSQREKMTVAFAALNTSAGAVSLLPRDPSKSHQVTMEGILILAAGGLLAFVFPLCLMTLRVSMDHRLRTADQVWHHGYNVIGTAPTYTTVSSRTQGVMAAALALIVIGTIAAAFVFQYLQMSQ